jgi:hypothetical protein
VFLVRHGTPLEIAALAEGIDAETLKAWLDRAEKGGSGNGPFMVFKREVDKARAKSESNLIERMYQKADEGDVKAIGWLLERGFGYTRPSIQGEAKKPPAAGGPAPDEPGDFGELDQGVTPIDSVRRRRQQAG